MTEPSRRSATALEQGGLVAYFCAEFGFHESLPIYSGGLGILAGDHCKAASDRRLPFVAVGLLYRQGYFVQTDRPRGQPARRIRRHRLRRPADHAGATRDGAAARWSTCRSASATRMRKVWQAQVGHVTLYLLDTDLRANRPERSRHRASTLRRRRAHAPRAGDRARRRRRARAARARHQAHRVAHQRGPRRVPGRSSACARMIAGGPGLRGRALEAVAANTVFTTHTPVPAGHDHFPTTAVVPLLSSRYCSERRHPGRRDCWRSAARPTSDDFNMTALALRGSRYQNGVSRIHGDVSALILARASGRRCPRRRTRSRYDHQRRARADASSRPSGWTRSTASSAAAGAAAWTTRRPLDADHATSRTTSSGACASI